MGTSLATLSLLLTAFSALSASLQPSTAAMLDPGDFLALQAIRNSLSDLPGSHFFSSWDFTSDPCTFPGVLCSSSRVSSLSLGPSLGRLHPSLSRLSSLRLLSLSPGRVSGPIPSSLSLLPSLLFLSLSHNLLSGPLPPFSPSLSTLDLSHNLLSGSLPPFSPSLSTLLLSHNRLSGPLPTLPSSLRRLDLAHNNLTGKIPSLPSSLELLSLSFNRFEGSLPPLSGLRSLRLLDLSFNLLSGPVPSDVFELPLQELRMQRNLFCGVLRPSAWVTIPVVDLSYNRLSGPVPVELAQTQRLYLNSNRFSGRLPEVFMERLMSSAMKTLYLQHNFLSRVEISPGEDMPASSSICLQFNCMVPPAHATCPPRGGSTMARPASQCGGRVYGQG
ncbi:uncharacterized protein LOC144714527 [Wolffia australiana]